MRSSGAPLTARQQLRRQWRLVGACGVPFIGAGFWLLLEQGGLSAALQGSLQTAAVMVYGWTCWGRALELNHSLQEPRLRPSLGAANWLTLLRGGLIAVLAGFLFQPPLAGGSLAGLAAWTPAALYIAAAALDGADGFLARVTGSETRLGEHLDTAVDALGLLIAASLIVWIGKAPAAYLCVGLGYYALKAAVEARRKAGRPIAPVQPRPEARLVAGCQMGFAGAAMLPLFEPAATRPAALILTAALLAGFARDWLVVCGHAAPDGRPLIRGVERVDRAIARFLPLVLRAAAVAGVVVLLGRFLAGEGLTPLSTAGCALLGTCAALLAFGVMTRMAGLAASVTVARAMAGQTAGIEWGVVLGCSVALIMTGAGDLKLWQPEDRFFMKRLGGDAPPGP
ncbi:MAG: CDP-alcohol phosphatidyltransferase family protein [Deltaproteobacteria bacterium]|nr:CDP-alcohol phosphatidyltransferase family protein [Deltaproteobacteria bacterium]